MHDMHERNSFTFSHSLMSGFVALSIKTPSFAVSIYWIRFSRLVHPDIAQKEIILCKLWIKYQFYIDVKLWTRSTVSQYDTNSMLFTIVYFENCAVKSANDTVCQTYITCLEWFLSYPIVSWWFSVQIEHFKWVTFEIVKKYFVLFCFVFCFLFCFVLFCFVFLCFCFCLFLFLFLFVCLFVCFLFGLVLFFSGCYLL